MKKFASLRLALCFGAVAMLVVLCVGPAPTGAGEPEPGLKPTYGTVNLKSGFEPDPHEVKLVAGGPIQTSLGGVDANVAKAPDYRLNYEKGVFPLIFFVRSKKDTTLLINLPDGKWIANDDGGGDNDPLIKIDNPKSGRYDIYVGTFEPGNAPATLKITERN